MLFRSDEVSTKNSKKIIDKLAHYEDLEEQGRLVELPFSEKDKIKATSIEVVARVIDNKIYYGLKYKILGEDDYHIGYSSFYINNVFKWYSEYFILVKEAEKKLEEMKK